MLRIVGIVVLVFVVAVAGVLAYAATKPDDFRVQRSIAIKAPPEKIMAVVGDLKGWTAWSPYEKKDPGMKRAYAGAPAGKGAIYEWDGNKDVGHGRMEILESTPSKVVIKLDFITPFEAHNTAEFTAAPRGDSTNVTWAMYGPSPYMAKVMQTVMNMDKMIGTDFEAGLASLKTVAEK
ncbi:MAG: SRPBCC family protein [Reyranella sp.]|uniref:SRPBCC family protein n=1 Tax=Reyranella sp. TaxID=1929291 RepID=UPI001AC1CA08|nr:SRPBCC family protein [Reyranella sp.]MBN9090195.1 SRPBCC family protein [Reyranella sp.]